MELTTLTDDELHEHRRNVEKELERRRALSLIPSQVEILVEKYASGGGDMQVLVDCVTDPRHVEEVPNG